MVLTGVEPLFCGCIAVQALATALLQEQVPPQWEALWEGCPDTPADYCRAALRRATAIERLWYAPSQSPGGLLAAKQPLDLSQLFRPGALLNALRQAAARQSGVPLDGLRLATSCDPRRLGGGGAMVVQLGGLMLQGASFNGTQLRPVEVVSRGAREQGHGDMHVNHTVPETTHVLLQESMVTSAALP